MNNYKNIHSRIDFSVKKFYNIYDGLLCFYMHLDIIHLKGKRMNLYIRKGRYVRKYDYKKRGKRDIARSAF